MRAIHQLAWACILDNRSDFIPDVSALDPKMWDGVIDSETKNMIDELGFSGIQVTVDDRAR